MSEPEILNELKVISQKLDRLSEAVDGLRAVRDAKRNAKRAKSTPPAPTPEEIRTYQSRFAELYEKWLSGKEIEVQMSLEALDPVELRRFADSNNLNVTAKMSKDRVLQLISARFREKRQLLQTRPASVTD